VQDIEALCAAYSVPMVFTYAFFQELSREAQLQAKILTDLAGEPLFSLAEAANARPGFSSADSA
jgi:hypothetical protein